jgi:uncharacterized integral membrane protein
MRFIYLAVIVLFVIAIVLFSFQNFQTITVSFLGFSASAPLAVFAAIIYLLGMATGGSLIAALRRSIAGYRQTA